GKFVEPDITITDADIRSISVDPNRRRSTTVLAVRGRFTDPAAVYNEVDAAIWGDPYISTDDSQRTATVDNECVQSHNHCQRLQKLRMKRANAARVQVTVDYGFREPIKDIAYRRFVRLDYPARGLDNALVEIVDRPKLSLADLTYTFSGLVVDDHLYDFDASEEGTPGGAIAQIEPDGVPTPTGFVISQVRGIVTGGVRPAAYIVGEWTHVSDALLYELEWQRADASEAPQSVRSTSGEDSAVTNFLVDDVTYRFRLRAWSNGRPSSWTSYLTLTIAADYPTGAAEFDGSNDYLARGADLTGVSDGNAGTVSFWIKLNGGDSAIQVVTSSNGTAATARFQVNRHSTNAFRVRARNAAGTVILDFFTSSTSYTAGATWRHIIASWDLAAGVAQFYVDDASDIASSPTITNDSIDYTQGGWFVGASNAASNYLYADMADLWFNPTYLDLSVTANRRKFINAD
ncbi:MAG TPA: hypothetical protein PLV92_24200, partial [Pirellulaceae bacterium]|nr:hypothetical protein [Pirellulaceae bacterium]